MWSTRSDSWTRSPKRSIVFLLATFLYSYLGRPRSTTSMTTCSTLFFKLVLVLLFLFFKAVHIGVSGVGWIFLVWPHAFSIVFFSHLCWCVCGASLNSILCLSRVVNWYGWVVARVRLASPQKLDDMILKIQKCHENLERIELEHVEKLKGFMSLSFDLSVLIVGVKRRKERFLSSSIHSWWFKSKRPWRNPLKMFRNQWVLQN